MSTCFTSTLVTFTPQGSVCSIEDGLQAQVDLVAMRQQFVEFHFAQHRAQRGLRKLRGLVHVIRDLIHGAARIDHAQEDNGINFQA